MALDTSAEHRKVRGAAGSRAIVTVRRFFQAAWGQTASMLIRRIREVSSPGCHGASR